MKFSIRDLLLVTVIAALAVAWWLDRSRLAAQVEKLTTETEIRTTLDSIPFVVNISRTSRLRNSSAPAPNPPKP